MEPNLETVSHGHMSHGHMSQVMCHMVTQSHSCMSHGHRVTWSHVTQSHITQSHVTWSHSHRSHVTWSHSRASLQGNALVNRSKGYLEASMKNRCLSHPLPCSQLPPPSSQLLQPPNFRAVSGQVTGSPAGGQVCVRLEGSPLGLHLCFALCLWTHNREKHRSAVQEAG